MILVMAGWGGMKSPANFDQPLADLPTLVHDDQ